MSYAHIDVDECLEAALSAMDLCEDDKNSQCLNTEGSHMCVCVPGYERVNETCSRKQFSLAPLCLFGIIWFFVYLQLGIINEPPPPLPPVVTPISGEENSINYTATNLTPETVWHYAHTIILLLLSHYCWE